MSQLIKKVARKVKSFGYSNVENLVREATSNEPWSHVDSTKLVKEISYVSFAAEKYYELINVIWKRLLDVSYPYHVYKALCLIDYLMNFGDVRFVQDVRRRIDDIMKLQTYNGAYYEKKSLFGLASSNPSILNADSLWLLMLCY